MLGRIGRVEQDDDEEETDLLLRGRAGEEGDEPVQRMEGLGNLLFDNYDVKQGGPGGDPSWHPERLAVDYGYKMLDEAISATQGRFQHLLVSLCTVANFVDAAETTMLGLLYPTLAKDFNLDEDHLALIASLTNTGMLCGAIGFGKLSDIYGRKMTFVASMVLVFIFGLASSFATDLITFSILRMFLGFGYGGNLITGTTLLVEFVAHDNRGIWVMVTSFGFGVGAIIIAGISWVVIPSLGWQWLLRIAAFMALPALFLLLFVPESPRFYLMTHNFEKCVESMEFVAKMNGKVLPHTFNATTLNIVHHEKVEEHSWRDCYGSKMLLRRPIAKTLIPLAACWFLNAFAYVINNWLPIHGANSFPERSQIVYEIALVQAGGLLAGTMVQLFIVYFVSRLFQIRSGFLLSAFSVLLLGLFGSSSYQALFALAFAMQFFEQLIIGTLYLYTPEAFPTAVRVTAFGVCQANHRVAPIIAPYAVAALDRISFSTTCFVFASLFGLGFCCSLLVRVATFNKPLLEAADFMDDEEEMEKEQQDVFKVH